MRKALLLIPLVLVGCATGDSLSERIMKTDIRRLEREVERIRTDISAERLVTMQKSNHFAEKVIGAFQSLGQAVKENLRVIEEMRKYDFQLSVETHQLRKDMRDLCVILRRYHKMKEDDSCYENEMQPRKRKTENQRILEKFDREVKRHERRKRKGK